MKRLGTGAVAACVLALGATGVAQAEPGGTFTASTGEITFPATLVGETSATQSITFTGHSDADHPALGKAAIDSSDFVIVKDGCVGEELWAGDDCTVVVAYQPTAAKDLAADLTVRGGAHEESVLLKGTVAEPVVTPEPTPTAPVVAESAPAPVVIAPAIVAPVVAVKPAQAAKTATCVKTSSRKVVCTLKLGLAKTAKVKASLIKGTSTVASNSRKGDGKVTLKSVRKLKAKSYTLKLSVAGKTAMRTSVKLG